MKPENSSATDQSKGQKFRAHTGNTANPEDIPPELRGREGVKEGITEGAAPAGDTRPQVSPANEGRRNVHRGLHS